MNLKSYMNPRLVFLQRLLADILKCQEIFTSVFM